MISSKPPTSTMQLGEGPHHQLLHHQTRPVISTLFSPPQEIEEEKKKKKNIHGDKYWNELSLDMSRGRGCRNAPCAPSRIKPWFIKIEPVWRRKSAWWENGETAEDKTRGCFCFCFPRLLLSLRGFCPLLALETFFFVVAAAMRSFVLHLADRKCKCYPADSVFEVFGPNFQLKPDDLDAQNATN